MSLLLKTEAPQPKTETLPETKMTTLHPFFTMMTTKPKPEEAVAPPTSWRWTGSGVSKDKTTMLFFYDKEKRTTKDVHAKLEAWFPEWFYDWTAHDGEVHVFKNKWRWGKWIEEKKADGTWAEWYADFSKNGGKGLTWKDDVKDAPF